MNNACKTMLRFAALTALSCSSGLLHAQPGGACDGPRKPPQEAIEACKSLSAGEACSFATPRGTATGSCWQMEGNPLACKPKEAPEGRCPPKKP